MAGWLGSYGGEDSPDDISRGIFAGEVGSPRLLKLFEKYGLRTTWFIPGHSIETFPEQMKMVVDGGHEVGTHGYSHENPVSMTPQQEKDVIDKCVGLVEDLTGKKPAGNSTSWWEPSDATNEILLEYGYKYDRSLQHNDFTPYWARKGDQWPPIDYSQPTSEWMKPLVRGEEIDLVKIPLFPRASPPSAFAYTPPMEQTSWNTGIVPGDVKLAFGRVGEGPEPVLALHGITAQHRTFNATARYIEHQSGMVALDLRGRGDSGKPSPGNYGLGRHARDAIRTLDYLGVERCVLVGHSMGAFVALHTALLYPDRVRGLVLLDGGWPRPEEEPDEEEAAAIAEGLERAYRRLDMVFETPNDYLDFWFPGQHLTLEDLPPDLADYYLYDLEKVDGGYTPKASREAAEEDGDSVSSESPTVGALRGIVCPVALVRAEEGFFPDSRPLISDETRDVIAGALDLCLEHRLQGANHYTMMFFEFARQVAAAIDDLLRRIG